MGKVIKYTQKKILRSKWETQEQIAVRFSRRCNYTHGNCREIQTHILKLHNYDNKVDNNFLTSYLIYLSNSNYNRCLLKLDNWVEAVIAICRHIIPSSSDFSLILHYGCNDPRIIKIFKILIERGVQFDIEILKTAIKSKSLNIVRFLIDHIVPDSECLELLCNSKNTDDIIEKMIDHKIQITTKCLNNCISSDNYMMSTLIDMGVQPNENSLVLACKKQNKEAIKTILQCRIEPTKRCFNAIVESAPYSGYGYMKKFNTKMCADTIDIIIAYGYKIDYEDVVKALSKHCYINDINRFNLDLGSDFLEKCTHYNYYPYEIEAKPTLKCLYIECERTSNLKTVKKLISQGVKPDIECLRRACKNRSNKPIIQYLIENHNLVPDIQCLQKNAECINNVTLSYLLSKIPDQVNKSTLEDKPKNKLEDKPDKPDKINSQNAEKNVMEEFKSLADELEIDIIIDKEKTRKNKIKIIDDNMLKLKTPNKVPKSKRIKCKISPNVLKFLNQKPDIKLSFIDLRKLILDYVKDNKLYDKNKKTLIKPNKELCKLLDLEEGKYINFNNFDDLVSQCYKN